MDLPALTAERQGAATPVVTPDAPTSQLSSDFEVFLQMLTAQMRYQDPLNPIDSTDYATQLATFSGVEQAVQTNDLLKTLTTQLGVGGLSEMANWVGKEVRSAGPAVYDGSPLELYPQPVSGADQTDISVRNAAGEEVQRIPLPIGAESVQWSGVQFGGLDAPAGSYSFTAIGRSNGQAIGEAPVETYARVTEARLVNGEQLLVLRGGATVALSAVSALRES